MNYLERYGLKYQHFELLGHFHRSPFVLGPLPGISQIFSLKFSLVPVLAIGTNFNFLAIKLQPAAIGKRPERRIRQPGNISHSLGSKTLRWRSLRTFPWQEWKKKRQTYPLTTRGAYPQIYQSPQTNIMRSIYGYRLRLLREKPGAPSQCSDAASCDHSSSCSLRREASI